MDLVNRVFWNEKNSQFESASAPLTMPVGTPRKNSGEVYNMGYVFDRMREHANAMLGGIPVFAK